MRAKKRPPIPVGRDGGQISDPKFINRKNYTGTEFERATKNWAINKLIEYHFDGKRTMENRWAKAFWQKSGRRLKNV